MWPCVYLRASQKILADGRARSDLLLFLLPFSLSASICLGEGGGVKVYLVFDLCFMKDKNGDSELFMVKL